jgi:hypothetical protein
MKNLQRLIKKAQAKNKNNSFTVLTNPIKDLDGGTHTVEITYRENDLTKNYVKFLNDVFDEQFGMVGYNQVIALGNSIKSSPLEFKESYQKKKSAIKKIEDGVFIHTSMSSNMMKIKIKNVVDSLEGQLIWLEDVSNDLSHSSIVSDEIIKNGDMFKIMYMFQFERKHFENELNKEISEFEFKRFIQEFDSSYYEAFYNTYDHYIKSWKINPDKYKKEFI